jgi:hypothetical protein
VVSALPRVSVSVPRLGREEDLRTSAAHVLMDISGGPGPSAPTTVRFGWTSAAFLALFDAFTEPPILVARAAGEEVYRDECAELFLASRDEPHRYQELVVNASGALYTARVWNPDDSRDTWELRPGECAPGVEVSAWGGPGEDRTRWERWGCRIRVPWSVWPDGRAPSAGESRRANAMRTARGRTTRFLALSPTGRADPPDFHVPSRFAHLTFVD